MRSGGLHSASFLYYPLGFRREGNQVKDISGLEESAKGGHREHKKDRLKDIKPWEENIAVVVTGDHGAVSKQDMVMTKKIEEQDFLEWDSSW